MKPKVQKAQKTERKGNRHLFLSLSGGFFLLLLMGLAWADHPLTVHIAAAPAALPITVDEEFDLEVYLSAGAQQAQQAQQDLFAAELRLVETAGNNNFDFVTLADSNLADGLDNFNLDSNGPDLAVPGNNRWLMEGSTDGINPAAVTAAEKLLGKIRVRATAVGPVALSTVPVTKLVQAMEDVINDIEEHTFTVTLNVDVINIQQPDAFSCTGAEPLNSALCADDDQGLAANTARSAVSFCSAAAGPKCESLCNEGFQPNNDHTDCEEIPPPPPPQEFTVSSAAVVNGEITDNKYTCYTEPGFAPSFGVSPPLLASNLPAGTTRLALIVDDPDVPASISSTPFVHWLIFNFAPNAGPFTIAEADPAKPWTELANDFDSILYHGPCPPAGERHQYRFRIYALSIAGNADLTLTDAVADNEPDSKAELLSAMGVTDEQTSGFNNQPVLGLATLTARYPPLSASCSDTYPSLCTTQAACTTANNVWDSGSSTCQNACPAGTNNVANVCISATCGNEVVNPGEQCDDGDGLNSNACKNDCTNNVCGDGFQLVGQEQCDDGNKVNTDPCTNDCKGNFCGDEIVNYGLDGLFQTNDDVEECDDGNSDEDDGCFNCQSEQCTQDTDCPADNSCIANSCTSILTNIRIVLENGAFNMLQKISSIAGLLRTYFT